MAAAGNQWLFIVNPRSGTGDVSSRVDEITTFAGSRNWEVILTRHPGHATELAKSAIGIYEAVIAVGGDGTVREVASGLSGSSTPMGILPVGSGNGLARHLGISMNIRKSLKQLVNAVQIRMDGYLVNGQLGFNVAGVGFDGAVSELFARQKKRGLASYLRSAVSLYGSFPSFYAEIDGIRENCFVVAFANSTQYGNDAIISGHSSVQDGMLDCILLRKPKLFSILWMALCLRLGWYGRTSPARKLTGSAFRVRTETSQPLHIDGEYIGHVTAVDVAVLPSAIAMLVPAGKASQV